jgi:hypothetical protein
MDLQLAMQSLPITTEGMSFNLTHGKVYSIQHYVIKLASDLGQVGDFLWFPPTVKLTSRYNWNIVESDVKYHNPPNSL